MRQIDMYTKFSIIYQSDKEKSEKQFLEKLGKEFSVSVGGTDSCSILTKKSLETRAAPNEFPDDAIKRNNLRIREIAKAFGTKISLEGENYYF